MSFLRCWQLRKAKKTAHNECAYSNNQLHENSLQSDDDDETPPYGQHEKGQRRHDAEQRQKNNNVKMEGKRKGDGAGAVSLIDPFKKSKKKCGGDKNLDNAHGRVNNGVTHHQKRAKVPLLSVSPSKKVSWDAADGVAAPSRNRLSRGSYDYIDADDCHDVAATAGGHSSAFYPMAADRPRGARGTDGSSASQQHHRKKEQVSAASSPQSRYAYLDFVGAAGDTGKQQDDRRQQQRVAAAAAQSRHVASAVADEPLYATASSQIYSLGGSEDPYSSIVSIGGGYGSGSAAYDQHGYTRIINGGRIGVGGPGTSSRMAGMAPPSLCKNDNKFSELDELYAKIDHRKKSLIAAAADPTDYLHQQQHGRQPLINSSSLSTSAAVVNGAAHFDILPQHRQPNQQRQPQPHAVVVVDNGGGESGSGSVCSSTQPSYRYLTVREDVAVIRERVRQREEADQEQRANLLERHLVLESGGDDAYYSTIGNEYETVGDGGNDGTNGAIAAAQQPQNYVSPVLLSSAAASSSASSASTVVNAFRQCSTAAAAVPPLPPSQNQHLSSLNVDITDNHLQLHHHEVSSSSSTLTPLPPTSPIPKFQPQQPSNNNYQHQQHHRHQQQAAAATVANVPVPPPPPPAFIRRPLVMPPNVRLGGSSENGGSIVTNGKCRSGERAPASPSLPNAATSPKKSAAASVLRFNFFGGASPLGLFSNNNKEAAPAAKPVPPTSPPPKATTTMMMAPPTPSAAEANGHHSMLLNGTGTAVAHDGGGGGVNGTTSSTTTARHSRIPIFYRQTNAATAIRTRTPSPSAAAAPTSSSALTTMMTASQHCTDAGTQTMALVKGQRHQPQHFANQVTAIRDKSPSRRAASPLPMQVGLDYVSTIELSKKGRGGAAGGDQRGWPLKSTQTTPTTTTFRVDIK